MTPDQFIQSQRNKIKELVAYFPKAVADVHADQMKRIYEDGQLGSSGNRKYQYNSTKEIWVDVDSAPKIKPKSKPGSKRKATKTAYFKSYKAFKGAIGQESSFVNLRLNERLKSDHTNSLTKINDLRWVTGVKNKANAEKVERLEKKYGKFYKPTRKEKAELNKKILEHRLRIGL